MSKHVIRLLSLLLCMAMVLSMVRVNAAAEETQPVPAETVTEATEEAVVEATVEETAAEEPVEETAEIVEETTVREEFMTETTAVEKEVDETLEELISEPAMEAEIVTGARDANTPLPFAWTHAEVMSGKLTMGGKSYYDGILFDTGTLNGPGIISYNFDGLYQSLSFDASFIGGGKRNATMTITADGVVVYEETIGYANAVKNHTISLVGVKQLTIKIYSRGENTAEYGIANIKAIPKTTLPEKTVRTSCDNFNERQYLMKNVKVKTGKFEMGGYEYKNGYLLEGSTLSKETRLCFNFEGKARKLSFDIAKYMGSSNATRSAYLTIELDGNVVEEYNERELSWNALCLPVALDLTNVRQVVIKFTSKGEFVQTWAIGNIQIDGDTEIAPVMPGEEPIEPYAWTHAEVMSDKLTMGGRSYYDGILFDTGTLNGAGIISYNFDGLYQSLSFDASFVGGGYRDATMTITADGEVVAEETIRYEDAVKNYTIPLNGVRQLTIKIYSRGENTAEYGIANIKATPKGTLPEEYVRVSCGEFNDYQYLMKNVKLKTGKFEMGGYEYMDGYLLEGSTLGGTAQLGFNFDGSYKKLSFDIAKFMGTSNDTRSAYLTIELDGRAVEEYDERELRWNDLCLPVELDLTGVQQVVIKFKSKGEFVQTWAIGNVQIQKKSGPAHNPQIKPIIETTPMYRLYNPNSGEHFYTGSVEERENLVGHGWQYEGIAWNAPTKTGDHVHRLFNPNNGDHHYTMSLEERDMLVGVGWKYEGVAWNSASAENIPQYRLYNPNADCGSHHYTGSEEERDYLVSLGWHYEGIGWFGMLN